MEQNERSEEGLIPSALGNASITKIPVAHQISAGLVSNLSRYNKIGSLVFAYLCQIFERIYIDNIQHFPKNLLLVFHFLILQGATYSPFQSNFSHSSSSSP
jgi:hypothetical protein